MATVIRQVPTADFAAAALPVYRVVYYLLDALEIVLVLRFVFRLVGATSASDFANLVYELSAPLVAPFFGILRQTTAGGAVVEWATLIAMVVYALLAWALVRLISLFEPAKEEIEYTP